MAPYPLVLEYCGVCGLPPEQQPQGQSSDYCEYGPDYDKCKQWLQENCPEDFEELEKVMGGVDLDEKDAKKRQTRGGKANRQVKKKTAVRKIVVTREQRSYKKWVTLVAGLPTYEIDLKKAAKLFANKFSCGASVTADDEIVIQGDLSDDLIDLIQTAWPQIDEDSIEDKT